MIVESIAFGGGAFGGAGIKMLSRLVELYANKKEEALKIEQARAESQEKATTSARKFAAQFKAGLWARRFMVLTVFSYLFVFPAVAAYLGFTIHYGYVKQGSGFIGWLLGSLDSIKFKDFEGFVVMPFQTVLASIIAGFYFGSGVAK